MNKSQELVAMILRARIKEEETRKQHEQAWFGQEPEIIEEVEKKDEE